MERQMLLDIARQLIAWAKEAENGGWSTQHVEPMQRKADEIFRYLGTHSDAS